jgi:hypothetical protein
VRAGHGALKITIREGDPSPKIARDGTERDELQENDQQKEGEEYAYAFSIFIPKDFSIVPTRLVLAQWKHADVRGTATVDNPIIALRYSNGELSISTQTGEKKITRFRTKEDVRGQWLDFVFRIKFSRTEDGFLNVSLNDKQVLDFHGPTAYAKEYGYPDGASFYFKMGLYRDHMKEPMTIFFDEYRRHPLSNEEKRGN